MVHKLRKQPSLGSTLRDGRGNHAVSNKLEPLVLTPVKGVENKCHCRDFPKETFYAILMVITVCFYSNRKLSLVLGLQSHRHLQVLAVVEPLPHPKLEEM